MAQADINFESELWETAVSLRGTVAPADYSLPYHRPPPGLADGPRPPG